MSSRVTNEVAQDTYEIQAVDVILNTTSTAGTKTVPDMSQYQWIIICGLNSGYYNSSITLPYSVFSQGDEWWVNTYNSNQKRISVRFYGDTSVLVGTSSNSQSVKILGVR